jgi:hypothetical protein
LNKALNEVGSFDLGCTDKLYFLTLVDALEPRRVLDLLKRTVFVATIMKERDWTYVVGFGKFRRLSCSALLNRYALKLGLDTLKELKIFVDA